jgi:hypothetical protein
METERIQLDAIYVCPSGQLGFKFAWFGVGWIVRHELIRLSGCHMVMASGLCKALSDEQGVKLLGLLKRSTSQHIHGLHMARGPEIHWLARGWLGWAGGSLSV